MVNAALRPLYPRKRDPVFIVQEAELAPGPIWKGSEIFSPTGIRCQDFSNRCDIKLRRTLFRTVLVVKMSCFHEVSGSDQGFEIRCADVLNLFFRETAGLFQ